MNKRLLFNTLCVIAITIAGVGTSKAFSSSGYATSSALSKGKWVKIAIPEDGMYQITFDELTRMGFENPQKVGIFGTGGHPLSEILNGSNIDDLKQVPSKIFGNKLCFYACGPVQYTMETPTTTPHFTRKINSCSTWGY